MEYMLSCKDSAYPCEVTIDEDNGRYLVRNADSSGEFFNNPEELVSWILKHWHPDQFNDKQQFNRMVAEIKSYAQTEK